MRICQHIPAALLLISVSIAGDAWSQTNPTGADGVPVPEDRAGGEVVYTLGYLDALVLGLVEGVTEFLPISSTGHLILTEHVLGLNGEGAIPPGSGTGDAIPGFGEAVNAYTVVIQVGAIMAVGLLYWGKIVSIFLGVAGRDREGALLARNLLVAFIPAVVAGVTLESLVEKYLFNTWNVAAALFAGGFLMIGVEKWRSGKGKVASGEPGPDLHDLSIRQSLFIGLLQCVALWPGTSRSMMTMIGGYLAGLAPRRAAEFSFLLGLPTLAGAAAYKSIRSGAGMLEVLGWGPILFGCGVAAVSAAIAVKWMVGYLSRHGFVLFGWYRIVLAIVILVLMLK